MVVDEMSAWPSSSWTCRTSAPFSQGEARGRSEGEARGRAAVLLKQLTLKFGTLPSATLERVQSASTAELDLWAERILSAKTLQEVLG